MFFPATPQPAAPLEPVGITASGPAIVTPERTSFDTRREYLNVLVGHNASVTGTLLEGHRVGLAGQLVALQALGRRGWHTLSRARTHTGGRFRVSFAPRAIGSRLVRLRFAGSAQDRPSARFLGSMNVYRLAEASWYGGGGNLACGGALTASTMGVANKTLPCGTLVTLRYDGHIVRVPVVDRGPYVAGREFDLTEATKDALGFAGVGEVWSTS